MALLLQNNVTKTSLHYLISLFLYVCMYTVTASLWTLTNILFSTVYLWTAEILITFFMFEYIQSLQ